MAEKPKMIHYLAKTRRMSGGLYVLIPTLIVETYDLKGRETVEVTLRIVPVQEGI